MSINRNLSVLFTNLLMFSVLVSFGALNSSAQDSDLGALKNEASKLMAEDKYIEALPILEKVTQADPNDAQMQFHLGFALLAKTNSLRDKATITQMRIRARKAFDNAKKLGSQERILDSLIESIPADGLSPAKYSQNPEAEEFMLLGETAFTKGDYEQALVNYGKALNVDKTIYEAALYSGDMYMRKSDFDGAEIWYQKAIKINPDRETAYRYSATPLMKQKKYDQARDRYIEAYISEPYNRFSSTGIGQWADAVSKSLGHPKINIPVSVKDDGKGGVQINLDFSALMSGDKDDGSAGWLVYGGIRKKWRTETFRKTFPDEEVYRHSLKEETEALQTAISTAVTTLKKKSSKLNTDLSMLKELNDKGLLESYILLAIPSNGIAEDHAAYLRQNRNKLRQYVLEYVIH